MGPLTVERENILQRKIRREKWETEAQAKRGKDPQSWMTSMAAAEGGGAKAPRPIVSRPKLGMRPTLLTCTKRADDLVIDPQPRYREGKVVNDTHKPSMEK